MMEGWLRRATKENNHEATCVLHAHLAYLCKNYEQCDMTQDVVSLLLSSQIFLYLNYRYDIEISPNSKGIDRVNNDETVDESLLLPQTEIFDMFQRHRRKVVVWLTENPEGRNEVLEAVVRVITRMGTRKELEKGAIPEDIAGVVSEIGRSWVNLERPGCNGRFVPEKDANPDAIDPKGLSYEEWMRQTTTQMVETEVNVQLGEFTLRRHTMGVLDEEVTEFEDFYEVFGKKKGGGFRTGDRGFRQGGIRSGGMQLQASEVMNTEYRKWMRLVGLQHDVQLWSADVRKMACPYHRMFNGGLNHGEQWIRDALHKHAIRLLRDVDLMMPSDNFGTLCYANLAGYARTTPGSEPTLKEVVVYRDPEVVHIFDVVEHGRRFYRTLVYTTDARWTLHSMSPTLSMYEGETFTSSGDVNTQVTPAKSLVITREIKGKIQTFIPDRFLVGAVPTTLLEDYNFWQEEDDSLIGEYKPDYGFDSTKIGYIIRIKLFKDMDKIDETGGGWSTAFSVIQRVPLVEGSDPAECLVDESGEVHTLLNLLCAPGASPLKDLAKALVRLESLSHVLVWTKAPVVRGIDGCSIDLVPPLLVRACVCVPVLSSLLFLVGG